VVISILVFHAQPNRKLLEPAGLAVTYALVVAVLL